MGHFSDLVWDQVQFLRDKATLIQFAAEFGIFLTETEGCVLKDRKTSTGERVEDGLHMPNSLHYERCATDFMIYDDDGKPIFDGSDHRWEVLGDFWESLDDRNAWGGHFNDANHFSRSRGGRK